MTLRKETENVFETELTGHLVGAVGLATNISNAKVSLVTEGPANRLRVRIFTRDQDGSNVVAVQQSNIAFENGELKVYVPYVRGASAGTTVHSSSGSVNFMNGVVVTGLNSFGGNVSHGVEVEIDVLARNVDADLKAASLKVVGPVDRLGVNAHEGSVNADDVDRLSATVEGGSLRIGFITGTATIKVSNGSVKINKYNGYNGDIKATNGSVKVDVGTAARGDLTVTADNGSVKIEGSKANPNVWVNASARNGSVKKS